MRGAKPSTEWMRRSTIVKAVAVLMLLPFLFLIPREASFMKRATMANTLASKFYIPDRPWRSVTPGWCSELMANPREGVRRPPYYLDCRRVGDICSDGKPRFFSQFNQDMYTWQNHWKYLSRPGVYVDIAANEPKDISNSYFFDRCLGWRGLCVEGNPVYISKLHRQRSCGVMPTCVSDRAENVTFAMSAGLGGIVNTNKNRNTKYVKKARKVTLTCVSTRDMFAAARMPVVDMMSLDVEGHELRVLQGVDWERTKINVIILEGGKSTLNAAKFLKEKGYRITRPPVTYADKAPEGSLYNDNVYIAKDVVWGKPV